MLETSKIKQNVESVPGRENIDNFLGGEIRGKVLNIAKKQNANSLLRARRKKTRVTHRSTWRLWESGRRENGLAGTMRFIKLLIRLWRCRAEHGFWVRGGNT